MTAYDEFWKSAGEPREHQRTIADFVAGHSPEEVAELRQTVQAYLHEQEVSYNILGVPGGSERPWTLDELPHVVAAGEFDELRHRLAQRARVLNAALEDIHGPQRLIREGVIPSDVILGNPH